MLSPRQAPCSQPSQQHSRRAEVSSEVSWPFSAASLTANCWPRTLGFIAPHEVFPSLPNSKATRTVPGICYSGASLWGPETAFALRSRGCHKLSGSREDRLVAVQFYKPECKTSLARLKQGFEISTAGSSGGRRESSSPLPSVQRPWAAPLPHPRLPISPVRMLMIPSACWDNPGLPPQSQLGASSPAAFTHTATEALRGHRF